MDAPAPHLPKKNDFIGSSCPVCFASTASSLVASVCAPQPPGPACSPSPGGSSGPMGGGRPTELANNDDRDADGCSALADAGWLVPSAEG